jgi:hypothetical protein
MQFIRDEVNSGPKKVIMAAFLTDYHAARFGGKKVARENLAFPGPALPGADQGGSQ